MQRNINYFVYNPLVVPHFYDNTVAYKNQDGELKKATDKANLGVLGNGAVIVQRGLSKTVWIAEGVEAVLSVAKAVPNYTVMASLSISQFKNIPLSDNIQTGVICADNEQPSAQNKKILVMLFCTIYH